MRTLRTFTPRPARHCISSVCCVEQECRAATLCASTRHLSGHCSSMPALSDTPVCPAYYPKSWKGCIGGHPDSSYSEALQLSGPPTLFDSREKLSRRFFQAIRSPSHKHYQLLPAQREISYNLRRQAGYICQCGKHDHFRSTLIPYGLKHWQ